MEPIIKINCLQVNNLKNIEAGTIKTNSIFENLEKSDIIGIYGQNGSGKTAVVEAFKILQTLLDLRELPNRTQKLVKSNAQTLDLKFDYLITNKYGEYTLKYQVKLGYRDKDENLSVFNESLIYRENQPRKKMKVLVEKIGNEIRIRNNEISNINEDGRVKVLLANEMSYSKKTSFIFRKEYKGVRDSLMTLKEIELVDNLVHNFNKDFHVIDNSQSGIIFANILIPFSFQLPNSRGQLPLDLNRATLLSQELYTIYENIINQVNIVLKKIIPGLMVIVNKISNETTENGDEGVRFELLSDNNGVRLPLRCESAGVLKLISILSTLISVYNNPNACVVIDELDSGIFEYLIGDLVEIIKDNGKGQLFFTSHNLRILEVLTKENIWFTSTNPQNRFIQLKMVKKLSNMRDMYLRAVQLGGQEESLYNETDSYSIRKAFREAGKKDV